MLWEMLLKITVVVIVYNFPVKNVSPREEQPGLNLSVQIPEVLTEEGNRDWQLPKA